MESSRSILLVGLAASALIGCGSAPSPTTTPPLATTAPPVTPAPAALPPVSEAPSAPAEPAPSGPALVRMYPVVRIDSLLDLTATEGGIEIRVGTDPGGGMLGRFRYLPIVNGAPDLEQQTDEMSRADTSGHGFISLHGRRPHLVYHDVSGFRSAAADHYSILGANNQWQNLRVSSAPGLGMSIDRWSKDRLLEWRGAQPAEETPDPASLLPRLRVLQGADKEAPSLPASLERKLVQAGFSLDTFTVFLTGEVFAVGRLARAKGFGTVLWKDSPREPQYFVTEADALTAESELHFVGGTSLTNVRLQVHDRLMRLDGAAWVLDRAVPKGSLPDVWFGSTLVRETEAGAFARLAQTAPWQPIEVVSKGKGLSQSFAVDPSGVIWKTEDDLLLSSKEPVKRLDDITEDAMVKARKSSK